MEYVASKSKCACISFTPAATRWIRTLGSLRRLTRADTQILMRATFDWIRSDFESNAARATGLGRILDIEDPRRLERLLTREAGYLQYRHEIFDVCPNEDLLYRGRVRDSISCPRCNESRCETQPFLLYTYNTHEKSILVSYANIRVN